MIDVFFFQAEDGIRDHCVTGVQTCALPICHRLDRQPGSVRPRQHPWGRVSGGCEAEESSATNHALALAGEVSDRVAEQERDMDEAGAERMRRPCGVRTEPMNALAKMIVLVVGICGSVEAFGCQT